MNLFLLNIIVTRKGGLLLATLNPHSRLPTLDPPRAIENNRSRWSIFSLWIATAMTAQISELLRTMVDLNKIRSNWNQSVDIVFFFFLFSFFFGLCKKHSESILRSFKFIIIAFCLYLNRDVCISNERDVG